MWFIHISNTVELHKFKGMHHSEGRTIDFWQGWGSLKQIVSGGCKHWKNAIEKLKCLQENGDTHKKIVCSRSRIHIKKNIFACENFPLSPSPPSKSNGPFPQIKDEAARRPKTSHFAILPSLIWRGGGGRSWLSIYLVQDFRYEEVASFVSRGWKKWYIKSEGLDLGPLVFRWSLPLQNWII